MNNLFHAIARALTKDTKANNSYLCPICNARDSFIIGTKSGVAANITCANCTTTYWLNR